MSSKDILFLDIDGVLNNSMLFHHTHYNPKTPLEKLRISETLKGTCSLHNIAYDDFMVHQVQQIDERALGLLKKFVLENDLDIVLSSTWRLGYDAHTVDKFIKVLFHLHGWYDTPCIGRTVNLNRSGIDGNIEIDDVTYRTNQVRGSEIATYLQDHDVGAYVILDDDGDFHETQPLVKIDGSVGLCHKNIALAQAFISTQRRLT